MNRMIIVLLLIVAITKAFGQSAGDLDSSFNTDGTVVTIVSPEGGGGSSIALQPDGKILVGTAVVSGGFADFGILRYEANGSPDTSFGEDGLAIIPVGIYSDFVTTIAVFPDSNILLAGYSYLDPGGSQSDVAIAMIDYDGNAVSTFGDGGIMTEDVGINDYILSCAIQTDNKILIAGNTGFGGSTNFLIERFSYDGILDSTFSENGHLIADLGPDVEEATSIRLQPDGKIVACGFSFNGVDRDFTLLRLKPDGEYDSSFAEDGILQFDYASEWNTLNAVAIQTDGKITSAGYSGNYPEYDFAVMRVKENGDIDSSFSDDGVATTDLGTTNDIAEAVILQSDGKIVAAGMYIPGPYQFALTRYLPDGSLDAEFNDDGIVVTNIPGITNEQINDAVLQPDGKIVVTGGGIVAGVSQVSVARYYGRLQNSCDSIFSFPVEIDTFTGSTVQFIVSGGFETLSYQWQTNLGLGWMNLFDAGQYEGVNNDTLIIANLTLENNNQYFRCIGNNDECTDTSNYSLLIVDQPINIESVECTDFPSLYPNPLTQSGVLVYSLENNTPVTIYITDGSGKKIKTLMENLQQSAGNHQLQFTLPENLTQGNYFIVIDTTSASINTQFIKR